MGGSIELGRVTLVFALPVDGYDEEEGRPIVSADAKPGLVVNIEFESVVTKGSQRNTLALAEKLLQRGLQEVQGNIAEWDAEHIGDLTVDEDSEVGHA